MSAFQENNSFQTYASLMVPVNLGVGAQDAVRLAASLSERFSSRLIGISAEDIVVPYYGDSAVAVDAALMAAAGRIANENLAKAETVFRGAAGTTNAIEWRSAVRAPLDFVLAEARAADLVVLGRQGPSDSDQGTMSIPPGDLVMELGRPILVVPPRVYHMLARNVVIAWKDTREARRAVWDALPLLMRAEMVWVVSVGFDAGDQGVDDVCAYLARHGVHARASLRTSSIKYDFDEIVEFALQEGADLIVSGAYGHSRMREWLLGGMTNDLLEATPVCCLMAH